MFGIGKNDVAYSILSVIEQSNAATNPYFVNTSFPTGTKVSRGGFMRCPFREIATAPQSGASQ
jgi:hypothetical protein